MSDRALFRRLWGMTNEWRDTATLMAEEKALVSAARTDVGRALELVRSATDFVTEGAEQSVTDVLAEFGELDLSDHYHLQWLRMSILHCSYALHARSPGRFAWRAGNALESAARKLALLVGEYWLDE